MSRTSQAKSQPHKLRVYSFLAYCKRPKSYLGKIMLVAFLGTHIPLLALFFYAISATDLSNDLKIRILIVALIATLVGTAITLLALQRLLFPITLVAKTLRQYLEKNQIFQLPTKFTDEAGILMADTLYTITKLDELIRQLKNYDPLTSLPNRMLFQTRLQKAFLEAQQSQKTLALMFLNLDGFANINASLGSEQGDSLLRQVAQRLNSSVREIDLISRIGGDEFAVIHPQIESIEDLTVYAQQILNSLSSQLNLNGHNLYISASMGIAVNSEENSNPKELITQADVALRLAKQQGRNTCRFYSAQMNEKMRRRFQLERDLHSALEDNELELFYQPQIDVLSGKIIGAEALLRWRHPQHGFVSPGEFIPIAEASGLILPIGDWILHTACTQNQTWRSQGYPELCVAVNLSAKQFQQRNLSDLVANALSATGLQSHQLELEITESLLMEDVQKAIATLENLHELGLMLALDDFGTGYSSLSYLKRFPIDFLKIDRSFVRGIPSDRNDVAITRSVIALAQSLQMHVIAEGVENQAQVDYLTNQGCDRLQGYYFSRPIPANDFAQLLAKNLDRA
ncbi:bifunctional diguanylate cyclase/phosphodiesterase [Oscillatoria salina]|uniref:bifunctional diguanylate cyclase/phosphodiesterase n=1 Tax=Oscillatoria salina TaxID=331517 RepID=UPI001CCC909D|nr:bifunctional diguanylate cyclase/phosphodiesterase [Oscillatoria salina]MBZ8182251.1 EAL domain-containing protein [Oscillatoria salina IIICB1]